MQTIKTTKNLQAELKKWRDEGNKIALVPTMGGLHTGHLALIELAKKCANRVVVSVFVNPAQFAQNEDFDTYPRDLMQDLSLLDAYQVDCVFTPNIDEIYPNGVDKAFSIGNMGQILCGKTRPHFFNGVVQVVARLFEIVRPDMAVFGEKDYQQLQIIKRFTHGIEIIQAPTVREADGLAMSTRNIYLSSVERRIAPKLWQILQKLANKKFNEKQAHIALKEVFKLDYLEILDADTLEKINDNTRKIAILCAVFLGTTRLIDNIIFRR